MKAEKLSTEIAALERQSGKAKNAVLKKVLTKKIDKLKAELEAITSAQTAKEKIKKAKTKVSQMTAKEFSDYIKRLSKDPKFAFLKGMTDDEINRDIKRTAKPVGWRFRGRENFKTPTKRDIKDKNDVYYEGRRNRSDVSRSVRLATGGGVNYNYEGQLPQKAVYSSVDEYLKNAKIGDLIWMGKDVNGFKLANKRDLMKIVELNGDDDFAFSFFGRKGKYTLASNNYDRNVVVVDNKKRENGGGVDINDLDMPVIRTQFEDEEYEYAKGGSVGDSGTITDKKSMFFGKMGTITGDLGDMYEVMVLNNGNKRTVLVKKNGISIVSDEYAKGGGVGESNNNFKEIDGNKYFSYDFENKGNKWGVLISWGKYNHVNVTKKTNNPFGYGIGKEFSTIGEAVDNYKDVNIKSNILFAANMAKEYGYEPKYENGGLIDINDFNMPVIRSQFEDEDYEFEEGGEVTANERMQSLKNYPKLKF